MKSTLLILLAVTCISAHAQDVLEMKTGTSRTGKIISFDEKFIRLELNLAAQGGSSVRSVASIALPRGDVLSIAFAPSSQRDAAIRSAAAQDIDALDGYWKEFQPWLEMPRSPSGSIACALGNALLATKERKNADRALELFTLVEEKTWQASDKARAREGRLRAMTATGKAAKAIEEAKALAAETEDPEILIEANYIMAKAAEEELKDFLKENPRWDIDSSVIDKRHQLQNRVLELYLYPSLFFGTNNEKAARGLWGAIGIYRTSGEERLAIETSRDIHTFYPKTPEAEQARAYLASLNPEKLRADSEAEARKEMPESPPDEASPPSEESTKPAKEKKKKPKNS